MRKKDFCRDCAMGKLGTTDCCRQPFLREFPGICITLADVARIVKHTGKMPDEFCRITEVDKEDFGLHPDDYVSRLFFDRKSLNMWGDKRCPFLGSTGCTIHDARPMVCRIFPFWYKENGHGVELELDWNGGPQEENCLIMKKNYRKNFDVILEHINESYESMMNNINQFIADMEAQEKIQEQLKSKSIMQVLSDNGFLD